VLCTYCTIHCYATVPIPKPNPIPIPNPNPNPTPNPIPNPISNRNPNETESLTLSQPTLSLTPVQRSISLSYVTTVALKLHKCKPKRNT